MKSLSNEMIELVGGAGDLRKPVDNPQSELGQKINDVAQVLNDFGGWVGRTIYDIMNP